MKLSVIIPCYDEVHTIEKVVEAVKMSPYKDLEVIMLTFFPLTGQGKIKERGRPAWTKWYFMT